MFDVTALNIYLSQCEGPKCTSRHKTKQPYTNTISGFEIHQHTYRHSGTEHFDV